MSSSQPVQLRDRIRVRHVAQPDRRQIPQHLVFQLVAVDHEQHGWLLRLRRPEQQLRALHQRVGLAAALRVPHQSARARRVETPRHGPVHGSHLVLPQHDLLQLLVLLREHDAVPQQPQHMRHRTERFDFRLKIACPEPVEWASFFAFPIENVPPHRVPGHPVGETAGLGRGEEHLRHHALRRLGVVAPDLIHAQRDGLVFGRVLALHKEHGHAVDQKDHILARGEAAVADHELLGHLIHVAPCLGRTVEVTIVDHGQVQLAPLLLAEVRAPVAQRLQQVPVAGDVRVKPLELPDQRPLGFAILRIERAYPRVQQVAEEERRRPRPLFLRRTLGVESAPSLRLSPRHIPPPDLLRVRQKSGLHGLMFSGFRHGHFSDCRQASNFSTN